MRRSLTLIAFVALSTAQFGCSSSSGPTTDEPATGGANLVVENLAAPSGTEHNGDIGGSVSFDVTNKGDVDAGNFDITVSIAHGAAGDEDVVLSTIADVTLAVGETRSFAPSSIPVPLGAPIGQSSLRVTADASKKVAESNDDDNIAAAPIAVQPLTGYLYRYAGTVSAAGVGKPELGAEGLPPLETGLYWPVDVEVEEDGTVYVMDWNNHRILTPRPDGRFDVIMGGYLGNADDGVADEIGLNHPTDVVRTPNGDLLLLAWHNSIIKRMDLATGYIHTVCGIDTDANNRAYNGDDIPADQAYLDLPCNGLYDAAGNFYFCDQGSIIIRMIDINGIIHTIAGTPPRYETATNGSRVEIRHYGYTGDGGPATEARLNFEFGQNATPGGRICMDSHENIYIADTLNHVVRVIMKDTGYIYTFAGLGANFRGYSGDEGPATAARLQFPRDVACDANDNIYIADTSNHCIRMVDTAGIIHTVAGVGGVYGSPGTEVAKPLAVAYLYKPYGIDVDPNNNLWIADQANNSIRVVYR